MRRGVEHAHFAKNARHWSVKLFHWGPLVHYSGGPVIATLKRGHTNSFLSSLSGRAARNETVCTICRSRYRSPIWLQETPKPSVIAFADLMEQSPADETTFETVTDHWRILLSRIPRVSICNPISPCERHDTHFSAYFRRRFRIPCVPRRSTATRLLIEVQII